MVPGSSFVGEFLEVKTITILPFLHPFSSMRASKANSPLLSLYTIGVSVRIMEGGRYRISKEFSVISNSFWSWVDQQFGHGCGHRWGPND